MVQRCKFGQIVLLVTICVVGYLYEGSGGLFLAENADGSIVYATDLMSSGSDESFLVAVGLMLYVLSLVSACVAAFRHERILFRVILFFNTCIFCGILWLVQLDVDIINSLQLGDRLLLVSIVSLCLLFPLEYAIYIGMKKAKAA